MENDLQYTSTSSLWGLAGGGSSSKMFSDVGAESPSALSQLVPGPYCIAEATSVGSDEPDTTGGSADSFLFDFGALDDVDQALPSLAVSGRIPRPAHGDQASSSAAVLFDSPSVEVFDFGELDSLDAYGSGDGSKQLFSFVDLCVEKPDGSHSVLPSSSSSVTNERSVQVQPCVLRRRRITLRFLATCVQLTTEVPTNLTAHGIQGLLASKGYLTDIDNTVLMWADADANGCIRCTPHDFHLHPSDMMYVRQGPVDHSDVAVVRELTQASGEFNAHLIASAKAQVQEGCRFALHEAFAVDTRDDGARCTQSPSRFDQMRSADGGILASVSLMQQVENRSREGAGSTIPAPGHVGDHVVHVESWLDLARMSPSAASDEACEPVSAKISTAPGLGAIASNSESRMVVEHTTGVQSGSVETHVPVSARGGNSEKKTLVAQDEPEKVRWRNLTLHFLDTRLEQQTRIPCGLNGASLLEKLREWGILGASSESVQLLREPRGRSQTAPGPASVLVELRKTDLIPRSTVYVLRGRQVHT